MTQKEMAAKFPIVNFNKTLIQIHEKVDQTSKYPSMKGILRLSRKQGCQGTCAPSCAKLVNQLGKICKTEVVKLVCKGREWGGILLYSLICKLCNIRLFSGKGGQWYPPFC